MSQKPRIHIIATGGTIAGLSSAKRPSSYSPAALSVDVLLETVPRVRDVADVSCEQLFNIPSQDITSDHWRLLASKVADFASNDLDIGLVVLHGTDTIEETAWFLDLVHQAETPVILVGAMRPADAISADGPGNLLGSVIVAADPQSRKRGVLIFADNALYPARAATKISTLGANGFGGTHRGMEGCLSGDRVNWLLPQRITRAPSLPFPVERDLPKVGVLYVHAALGIEELESMLANDPKAIVVAGVGAGNMPRDLISRLSKAANDGVIVIRSSRITGAFVSRNVEIDDDAHGFVAAGDLSPAKARILAQLALSKTRTLHEIQEIFAQY